MHRGKGCLPSSVGAAELHRISSRDEEHAPVMDLKNYIRSIPGFPTKGIVFRDITPLLQNAEALDYAVNALAEPFREESVDLVVGAEARGFIVAAPVAVRLGAGFVPVRRPGKLPAETIEETYELEYATNALAMHRDSVRAGQRVLMADDLLATGGTMAACCKMVERLGGTIVGCAFLVELSYLGGRDKLGDYRLISLIDYESEDV